METVLVNQADWEGPEGGIPEGWLIANASRPLRGPLTWEGRFRHGIFYAASPVVVPGSFGWKADDAWLVKFTDNEAIAGQALAKCQEYGYATVADADLTIPELAASMGLPWHEVP